MSVVHKLGGGVNLFSLDSYEKQFETTNLYNRCIMCREDMGAEEYSVEHIFPKWLQRKYDLYTKKLILPNGTSYSYNKLVVPCCKECNSGKMAEWESIIMNGVTAGYEEFAKIDRRIVAWWIYKLYYSKLVKETTLRGDIKKPDSQKMVDEGKFAQYHFMWGVMSNLIKGIQYECLVPYELYVFKTDEDPSFFFTDDISRHVVFVQMDDILIVCALDSYGLIKANYKKELAFLQKKDKIKSVQAYELFAKMVFYRSFYAFETAETINLRPDGVYIKTEISNFREIHEFDVDIFVEYMIDAFERVGIATSESDRKAKRIPTFLVDGFA